MKILQGIVKKVDFTGPFTNTFEGGRTSTYYKEVYRVEDSKTSSVDEYVKFTKDDKPSANVGDEVKFIFDTKLSKDGVSNINKVDNGKGSFKVLATNVIENRVIIKNIEMKPLDPIAIKETKENIAALKSRATAPSIRMEAVKAAINMFNHMSDDKVYGLEDVKKVANELLEFVLGTSV